jgi:hypothetical protein
MGLEEDLVRDLAVIVDDAISTKSDSKWWVIALGVVGVSIAGGFVVHKWRKNKRRSQY